MVHQILIKKEKQSSKRKQKTKAHKLKQQDVCQRCQIVNFRIPKSSPIRKPESLYKRFDSTELRSRVLSPSMRWRAPSSLSCPLEAVELSNQQRLQSHPNPPPPGSNLSFILSRQYVLDKKKKKRSLLELLYLGSI